MGTYYWSQPHLLPTPINVRKNLFISSSSPFLSLHPTQPITISQGREPPPRHET